jgi:cytochrome c-type biogenesis protein CcmH
VTILTIALFAVIASAAAAFAAWPAFAHLPSPRRTLPTAGLALLVAGLGTAAYLGLGRPLLATRTLQGRDVTDTNGAIALLVHHLHAVPGDLQGWRILGRAYLDARDGDDAVKAFTRAISLSQATGRPIAGVYSDYGMALAAISGNTMPEQAERAFRYALSLDPSDRVALFFMGQISAAHGQNADAIMLWQRLLSEMPPNSPFRQELVDDIARLNAASGRAPDIDAMVAGLAARLKSQPDDPSGWQRLVRAYAVLGDQAKARAALADARAAMAGRADVLNALSAEAKELKLEK